MENSEEKGVKNTAFDYLRVFVETPQCDEWLKTLIVIFLKTKGNLTEQHQEELMNYLLKRAESPKVDENPSGSNNSDSVVAIDELVHVSGVNALGKNQTLKLCKNTNVIFGFNGTGKSSYFRILKTMTGNLPNSELLANVYEPENTPVNVNVRYSINGTSKGPVVWDNTSTVDDFKSLRIFDSSYTSRFLRKRDSDEMVLKPYHLYVFSDLIEMVDSIKKKSLDELDREYDAICPVENEFFSEETKALLQKTSFDEEEVSRIETDVQFGDEDKHLMEELAEQSAELKNSNPSDAIKRLNGEILQCDRVIKQLGEITGYFEKKTEEANKVIANYTTLQEATTRLQKSISIFDGIPGSGSEKWSEFITAAADYAKDNAIEDECPYCHRKYDDQSLELAKAYVAFLGDETARNFQEAKKQLDRIRTEVEHYKIVSEDDIVLGFDKEYDEYCKDMVKSIKSTHTSLLDSLRNRKQIETSLDLSIGIGLLSSHITSVETRIGELKSSDEERLRKLDMLNKQISQLNDRRAVVEQRVKILDMMKQKNGISNLRERINSISTNKLTTLAKQANEALITNRLREEFESILKQLKIQDKKIVLQSVSSKGTQQTELIIQGNKNVSLILSEGEQKAVALAMFLAEISLSDNKSTIILDDPVNSLDHRIMDNLAKILLNLDNQTIIFTHNALFFHYIEAACKNCNSHICKLKSPDCQNNTTKHVCIYHTKSEGLSEKGVLIFGKVESANYYLDKLDSVLKVSPFEEEAKACLYIRKAVECLVDEKILNNVMLNKISNGNVMWSDMKKVSNKPDLVETLRTIHGRVSGGGIHEGGESNQNPVDKEEATTLLNELKQINSIKLE